MGLGKAARKHWWQSKSMSTQQAQRYIFKLEAWAVIGPTVFLLIGLVIGKYLLP